MLVPAHEMSTELDPYLATVPPEKNPEGGTERCGLWAKNETPKRLRAVLQMLPNRGDRDLQSAAVTMRVVARRAEHLIVAPAQLPLDRLQLRERHIDPDEPIKQLRRGRLIHARTPRTPAPIPSR